MKKHFILFILIWAFAGLLPLHAQQPTEEKKASQAPNFFEIQRQFKEKWGDTVPPPGSGYKPYKRWEYFWQHRIFPDGSFPDPDYREQAWTDYVAKHPEAKTTVNSVAANWTSLGPNTSASGYNGVGRVNCIAFHPTNSNIIWVGTAAGGIWKSTNGGNNWTTTTDNLIPGAVLGVSSIVVSASNPNILYAATGDKGVGAGGGYFPYSNGILKSTDGGATWNHVGPFPGIGSYYLVTDILVHPTNSSIIMATTSEGQFLDQMSNGAVYKSMDGGATWTKPLSGADFYDLEFKPGSPNFVYAASSNTFRRSQDGGEHWDPVDNNNNVYVPDSRRIQIGVSQANPSFVALISCKNNGGFLSFRTSNNSGGKFIIKYSGPKNLLNAQPNGVNPVTTGNIDDSGGGWYSLCITVSPTNANIIFIGAVNLWKSTDGGLNWTLANYWWSGDPPPGVPVIHADKHCLAWQSNSVLFQSNDGGIYKSTNGGSSWTDLSNSLVISQIYRIGVSSADSKIICGLQDNSTKLKNSNGLWTDIATGDGAESFIDPVYPNIIYYSRINGDLRKTTDGGNNVQSIKPQQLANAEGDWLTPWAMDPNASNTIYAGYLDVWKSTNGGISWAYISLGLSSTNLTSLVIAPSNSNVIYVSNGNQIWKTTSGGGANQSAWVDITAGINNLSNTVKISYIAIDPANPNKVYITLKRLGTGNRVYRSIDGGSNWENFSGSLPNVPANCITVQPQGNNAVYVGTDIGVFYRDATMSDWEPFNTGLPNVIVTELECKTTAGKIYAATFGRGLWESNLAGTSGTNSLSISPSTQTVNSSAGNASLSIASNISWTVSDNASWLTLSQSSGSGNASINASFTANTSTSARTATITASGGGNTPTATIVQSGTGGTGCNTPGNNQTSGITQNSALLSWSAVAGATSYAPQYRLAPNGAWTNTNPATFTSTSVTLNSLLSGTAYEWRVKTNCSNSTASNWSTGNAFTTSVALSCNTPTGLQSSNITQNSATLNWGTVLGAANYALQYRLGSSGNWLNTSPATTNNTTFTLSGLVANTTYQWRVSTNCSNQLASSWSAGIAFTTLAAPTCNAPVNLTTSNVTQNSALVSWGAVSGANNYSLQTRYAPNWVWANTNPPTFTGTSVTLTGLLSNKAYEWRVRANCTNLTSAWSSEEAFTTLPAQTCNAPTSLSTNNITQTTALLSWSAVSGANNYRVQLYSGGSWLDLSGGPFTTTSVNLYGLLANDYYEWRVITNCSNGLQSAPSYVASFYTQTAPVCNGGGIFPYYDLYPQGGWQYVYNMYGGQYSIVNVVAGYYYTFSFCSNHGGYVGFDGEIRLRQMDETLIAYNDDFCGTAPKIVWIAGYTGQVQVLLTKYPCTEQFTFSTLAYRLGNSFNDDIPDDRSEPDIISVPFVLDPPSSIAQVESSETAAPAGLSISVFPNPASSAFTIQYEHYKKVDTNIRMFVYNLMGALLWEQAQTAKPGTNLWEVQTNHWPTGLYKVRLIDEQGQQCTQTVFIQD